ncbi:MAG: hypothetical protein KDN05_09040, partial [Verrucomicrobiae bacterium]|nr:hypothetical protein [Verrucomicrobiae bacterium]
RFPEDYLAAKIDQFPFRHSNQNPAGLLAESIRRDLPPPSGYLPPRARAEQDALNRKRARQRSERIERENRTREASIAREDQLLEEAKAALKALSTEERSKLESEARKQFPKAGSDLLYWTMIALMKDRIVPS